MIVCEGILLYVGTCRWCLLLERMLERMLERIGGSAAEAASCNCIHFILIPF